MAYRLRSLYQDIYASLYEGVLRRSHGSEVNASVGAALALSGPMMMYGLLLLIAVDLTWGRVELIWQTWFLSSMVIGSGLLNCGWFLYRQRYRQIVAHFRAKSVAYRSRIAIVSWVYSLFPLGALLSISFIMARLAGQL